MRVSDGLRAGVVWVVVGLLGLPSTAAVAADPAAADEAPASRPVATTRVRKATTGAASVPAAAAKRFYIIPIRGPIIADHAPLFERAVQAARVARADHVVVYLDTPGGDVAAMKAIIKCIADNPDLSFVAVAREADSAGAVIAMSCSTILLTPAAMIGGALPYRRQADGTPENVDAKFRAFYDASVRAAVQAAGHNLLLARAMIEAPLVLVTVDRGGGQPPEVREVTPEQVRQIRNRKGKGKGKGPPAGLAVLKRPGQILVLTAQEALALGLAVAIVPEQKRGAGVIAVADDEVATALGFDPAAWQRAGTADALMKKAETAAAEQSFQAAYGEDLFKIDEALKQLARQARAVESDLQTLREQADEEDNDGAGVRGQERRLELRLRELEEEARELQKYRKQILDQRPKR